MPDAGQVSLSKSLWSLGLFIRDTLETARAAGELVQTSEALIKRRVQSMEYKDEGAVDFSSNWELFEKRDWHWKNHFVFAEQRIKQTSEFSQCVAAIVKRFSKPEQQASGEVLQFTVHVLKQTASAPITDAGLVEAVTMFIGDLEGVPHDIATVAGLQGIWLKEDRLQIGNIVLRRPTIADLETERSLEYALWGVMPVQSHVPPAILEFSVRGKAAITAQIEATRLADCLRLFRLGSVATTDQRLDAKSIFNVGGQVWQSLHIGSVYKYLVTSDDVPPLQAFIETFRNLVPSDETKRENADPAELAFKRFSDAVLRPADVEGRVTSAITCLEALFLKSAERAELTHKLSLRVAALLKALGFNALEVKKNVHDAYEIRSAYIHGGEVDRERIQQAESLCAKVMEYARLSVVVFLQLKGSKEDFVSKLDRSLLEGKTKAKIEDQLRELRVPGGAVRPKGADAGVEAESEPEH